MSNDAEIIAEMERIKNKKEEMEKEYQEMQTKLKEMEDNLEVNVKKRERYQDIINRQNAVRDQFNMIQIEIDILTMKLKEYDRDIERLEHEKCEVIEHDWQEKLYISRHNMPTYGNRIFLRCRRCGKKKNAS